MRLRALLLVAFLCVLVIGGCSSSQNSFLNGDHVVRHFTCIYDDFDRLHVDIDYVLFGIEEPWGDMRLDCN